MLLEPDRGTVPPVFAFRTSFVAVLLALATPMLSSSAAAQFEDEFADEFDGGNDAEAPAEAPAAAAEAAADDFDAAAAEFDGATEDFDAQADEFDAESDAAEQDVEEGEDLDPRVADPELDARRFRAWNSWNGATGGFHLADGFNAPAGTFRAQLGFRGFASNGFLHPEDEHSSIGGAFSLSWSVHDLVEVYASADSGASSNRSTNPELLIVLGDVRVGAKVGVPLNDVLSIGGDIGLILPTGNGLGLAFSGLGVDLRANFTADLRGLESAIPLLLRANLGYRFDRSENLIEDTENERYGQLVDPADPNDETRHLVTRAERFGLNINRTDFLHFGLGAEAPFAIGEDMFLAPLLEWTLAVPVNRQGYDCPFIASEPGGDSPRAGDDECLERVGAAAFPSKLTVGARFLPPVRGLGIFAGLDVGLSGSRRSVAVRELAQTAPWQVFFGVSYAHDARSPIVPEPVVHEREVEVEVPAVLPTLGRVRGQVVNGETNEPIPGAMIAYPGRELSAQRTGNDGTFASYELPPGVVEMQVSAPHHVAAGCQATIAEEGGDVQVRCSLRRALVEIEDDQVVILEKIQFAFDSDEILEASFPLMQQIADVFTQHPELQRVEIQGHTDAQGDHDYNAQLSQRRAESVLRWLTEHGVAESRLQAAGYGETRRLSSEDTEEAHERNRRVEFRILQRSE